MRWSNLICLGFFVWGCAGEGETSGANRADVDPDAVLEEDTMAKGSRGTQIFSKRCRVSDDTLPIIVTDHRSYRVRVPAGCRDGQVWIVLDGISYRLDLTDRKPGETVEFRR